MATKLKPTLLQDIQTAAASATLVYVSLFQLRLDPHQPRKLKLGFVPDSADGMPVPPTVRLSDVAGILSSNADDDQTALVRLALNILQDGVRTPITVTAAPDGLYQVVMGERRVTAAMLARDWAEALRSGKDDLDKLGYTLRSGYDYDRIAALVETVENAERFRMQVAENLLRQDMSAEDMGRAWKKMLDDGLFPNVYSIARHFGMEETRIQSHIDLLDMAEDAARLRSIGVTRIETMGRLLSSLRKARKNGESSPLYDNFVALWQAHTTQDENGEPVYPSARSILDMARRKEHDGPAKPVQSVAVSPEMAQPQVVSRTPAEETASVLNTGLDRDFQPEEPAESAGFAPEFAAEADDFGGDDVLPAQTSAQQFEKAQVGENLARSPQAAALDRPHQTDVMNVPAFDLTRSQAAKLMRMIGLTVADEELTVMGLVEAMQSI